MFGVGLFDCLPESFQVDPLALRPVDCILAYNLLLFLEFEDSATLEGKEVDPG